MQPTLEKQHIEQSRDVCGGRARVAGHRIRVQDIVLWTEQGQSPDQIVADFPQLSLADVYASLAYYHDLREEIDQQIRQDDRFVDELKAQSVPGILDRLRRSGNTGMPFWNAGMNTPATEVVVARAQDVRIDADNLVVDLADGRTLTVPLAWFPRLWYGSQQERARFEILGDGRYLHWPDLDEDLSIAGLLAGRRSGESADALKRWLAGREGKAAGAGG